MADDAEKVVETAISGNPPPPPSLGTHRDISPMAERLSNSTFIVSLSEAVAKEIGDKRSEFPHPLCDPLPQCRFYHVSGRSHYY